jgi:GAF domain-containing protein
VGEVRPVAPTEPSGDATVELGPLAEQFVLLTRMLLDGGSVIAALERVVLSARAIVPGADLVSVTLRSPDGAFHTPVATDRIATDLDQLQYRFGEGACVEAADPSGEALAASDDLLTDGRWRRFGPAAAELGFRSLLAAALLPDAVAPQLSGALNVYSRREGAFDPQSRNVMLLLAAHASLALAKSRAVAKHDLETEQLREALTTRDLIGQAKGILMSRRGISADEAFNVLRQTSQEMNVKLRALAETLTTNPDPPHPRL